MRSIRSMVGLHVLMNGKQKGHLIDVKLDEKLTQITSIFADCGFLGVRKIDASGIQLLGDVSVMVKDMGERASLCENFLRRAILTDGRRVGAITGALIDEHNFSVTALELSRGYFDDLYRGRQWIFDYAVNPTDGNVVIVQEGGKKV